MVFLSRSDNSILARWWWTVDRWNLIQILILAAIGIMMVWASTPSIVERYNDITDMEGYYENSENNQNRDADEKQDIKTDNKDSD